MPEAHRRKKQPESLRQSLLLAVAQLAVERGVPAVTLDAVARQAGVSKGGLQHHFPSKQALLEALFNEVSTRFAADVATAMEQDPEPQGRATRAYLRVSARGFTAGEDKLYWQAMNAIMMADPALIERWKAWDQSVSKADLASKETRGTLLMCRLAADGLWMSDLLGYRSMTPALRTELLARLQALTYLKKT